MSVNKVILVGNVGKDPEVRYFDNGASVVNFSLATTERGYTATNGTQIPDRTEWHNIVCWRGLAKVAEQYVKKGTQLYIEGKIRTRSYDDQQGVKRYIYEIFAETVELLGKRTGEESSYGAKPSETAAPSQPQPSQPQSPVANTSSDDDDLPF